MLLLADYSGEGKARHFHLAYLSADGRLVTSKVKNHQHGGMAQGDSVVLDEFEGHTHAVMPLPDAEPETGMDVPEKEVIALKLAQFQEAWDFERDSIERGQESVRFIEGDQWDSDQAADLRGKKRAALTINQCAPMVETLSGIFRQNRMDIRYFPIENGDQMIADVLTQVAKQILTANDYDYEETAAFEDEIAVGRGSIEFYDETDTDIRGFLRIRYIPWDMVLCGPHIRRDQGDMEYMFRWKWLSVPQVQKMYPEKALALELGADEFGALSGPEDTSDLDPGFRPSMFVNEATKQVRYMECEEKVYRNVKVYMDAATGFVVSEEDVPKEYRKFDGLPFAIIERRVHRIRKTVLAGAVLMSDAIPDLPVAPNATGPSFSVLSAYAYKRGSRFEGKIERAKDSQRELNKRRSQMTDIVNTTINNGWFVEESMFRGRAEFEQFKRDVSSAGFVVKVQDVGRVPYKVENGRLDPGIVNLELNALKSFREVTNVNVELLGVASGQESGVAIMHKQRQALVGNEYLFDNMSRLKRELGRQILLWIQRRYKDNPERLARLVMDQAAAEEVFINKQLADPNNQALFLEMSRRLQDADLLAYDVAVGESGASATTQLANLQLMLQMQQNGVPIPPEALLATAAVPGKEKIMRAIEQSKQEAVAAENRKYSTEILKTQIAKGPDQGAPANPALQGG